MRLKCIAIDDEPLALDIVKQYVEKIPFLELTGTYRRGLEAMDVLSTGQTDLIFLDIQMNDITGIELLGSISDPPMVIFTTAYKDYAIESYEHNAVDYLLKPFTFERFLKAANKALQGKSPSSKTSEPEAHINEYVFIKSDKGTNKLVLDELLYVEGLKE